LMAENLELGKVPEAERQREYFRFIGQECRRLSGLIENVLDFSRIDQGRKQYDFESSDLISLTRETVQLMQTYAEQRGVAIRFELPSSANGSLEIMMDAQAIQQALVNLLDNALKHSPRGEKILVEIETAGPGQSVRLRVKDRGPGIAASEHEKIFDRFYRVGSELRRDTTGVGIGLSIVKHIVEAHHGKVFVESAPGKGSCFTIELPATQNPSVHRRKK
jgi:signal transduction histidine kinase